MDMPDRFKQQIDHALAQAIEGNFSKINMCVGKAPGDMKNICILFMPDDKDFMVKEPANV